MPGCVWSRSHLPAAARRFPARKYISIFSIIFYIWHHLQPRRGDGDTSFTHNRGRVEVEGSPCKAASVAVVRWPGPCRRVCPASSWRWWGCKYIIQPFYNFTQIWSSSVPAPVSGELLPILLLYKQNIWCIPPPPAAAATDIECGDEAKLQSITWALVAGGCWARDWNGNGLWRMWIIVNAAAGILIKWSCVRMDNIVCCVSHFCFFLSKVSREFGST